MATIMPPATAPVPLRFTLRFLSPGTARLAVAGQVDLTTAPALRMRLLALVNVHRPAAIDINLAKVTFLDCSGVGVLIEVRNTAEPRGCQVRISHPQPIVARVLDVLGLLGLFTAPTRPSEPPPGAAPLPAARTAAGWHRDRPQDAA